MLKSFEKLPNHFNFHVQWTLLTTTLHKYFYNQTVEPVGRGYSVRSKVADRPPENSDVTGAICKGQILAETPELLRYTSVS